MDVNNWEDDDEPAAINDVVAFVYDGTNEVPDDVTHFRVLPTVTIIPLGSFQHRPNLVEVELPEGLIKIENFAFDGSKSLKTINLPSTLQEMGKYAFAHCKDLADIVLPTGLRVLGQYTFWDCKSLKTINIPPNVRMDDDVFYNCGGLREVSFAEGCESIGRSAFCDCESLTSVKLPSSLKVIKNEAFSRCEGLSDMKVPDAVESIEYGAFRNTCLKFFRIPPLVTDVNISMFDECNSLVSIELSANVRAISKDDGDDDDNYLASTCTVHALRNIALPPECALSADVDMQEICEELAVAFPDDESDAITDALKHRFHNLPIHKTCYYQSYHDKGTVLSDLKREINPWTSSKFPGQLNPTGKQQDCLGMTPLHILACSSRQDVEIYQLLIGKYPDALITKDKWGDIPLLYAFWCNTPDEVIELLVESYKTEHPDYEFDWRGMLRILVKACLPLTNIQKLLHTQRTSFPDQKIRDMKALIMELAKSVTENCRFSRAYIPIDLFKYLLRVSITDRLDKLNVSRWSAELQNSINALHERVRNREGDTKAIYDKLESYESIKEASTVLELALWKMKIDESVASNVVSNVGDDQHSRKKAKVEDEMSPRNQCRINCGADIIISGILQYLEPNQLK